MTTSSRGKLGALLLAIVMTGQSGLAGAFSNLGFDQLNWPPEVPPLIPGTPFGFISGEWVRPGWYSQPQSAVGYNYSQQFTGWASIVDRDFRDAHFGKNSPVPVIGTFSLAIWPYSRLGTDGTTIGLQPYVLTQTGEIPADAQSLRFLYHGDNLKVFVAGVERSLHALPDVPTGDPEVPMFHYYSVDVSPFAGQTAELRLEFRSFGYDDLGVFDRLPNQPDAQSHVIDDLSFSPLPAVPEPSTWALLGLGAAVLAWGRGKLRDES